MHFEGAGICIRSTQIQNFKNEASDIASKTTFSSGKNRFTKILSFLSVL
jgi:hypothetical protein